jgi:5-methylcytosine-specific restriction endonuclease McrA
VTRSSIPEAVRSRVRERAGHRCGYCLAPQHLVLGWLEIEHIIPQGAGGTDEEENLWLGALPWPTLQ